MICFMVKSTQIKCYLSDKITLNNSLAARTLSEGGVLPDRIMSSNSLACTTVREFATWKNYKMVCYKAEL